jgi:transposase
MAKCYSLRPVKPVLTEIEQCLLEITNGDLSYREAQEKYGLPKSTLQRYMLNGTQTRPSGAKCKLTELEFETNAENCRANFIVNQQTTVVTLKQYVAEVTAARGVTWLNCLPGDRYTKDLIHCLKHRGIQFVTGRPTSMARVAANTSENLAPFFEACRIDLS